MEARKDWISNESPPWASYLPVIASRLVSLDKCPGVMTVGIGEVCFQLIAKIVRQDRRSHSNEACGSVNICVILEAGIKGAIHAVREMEELGRVEKED